MENQRQIGNVDNLDNNRIDDKSNFKEQKNKAKNPRYQLTFSA